MLEERWAARGCLCSQSSVTPSCQGCCLDHSSAPIPRGMHVFCECFWQPTWSRAAPCEPSLSPEGRAWEVSRGCAPNLGAPDPI